MKLYHYSLEPFETILAKWRQGPVPQTAQWGDYIDHGGRPPYERNISLFIEPLPVDTIAAIFNNEHKFYTPGTIVYEHVIDSEQWKDYAIPYRLVETPMIVRLINQFDFYSGKDKIEKFKIKLNKIEVAKGLGGEDYHQMLKAIKPYIGMTEGYFHHSRNGVYAEENKEKYAAGVPHLMIYPFSGEVKVESVRRITLGTQSLKERLYHLSFNGSLPNVLEPRQPADSGWVEEESFNPVKTKRPTTPEREACFAEHLPDRVSFTRGLEQAFLAIYPNVNQLFEVKKYPYMDMFVYRAVGSEKLKRIDPHTLSKNLWDYEATHEVAFLEPVQIERIAAIRVHRPKHKSMVTVAPCGKDKFGLEPVGPICDIEVLKQMRSDLYIETQQHFYVNSK